MKTAVIYARYSSDSQTEQSIEGQVRVCKQFAEKNDLLVVDQYIDRATTGTNDNRAAFQQMLRDSKKAQWGAVIVYKLDRFARNKYESSSIAKSSKTTAWNSFPLWRISPTRPKESCSLPL